VNAREAAALAAGTLERAGIPVSRLEAEYLVRHAAGLDRVHYFLAPELDSEQLADVQAAIERRLAREPLTYIVREREFWGRPFTVTPDALIPRPETELLVEFAARETPPGGVVADIGTGTGCIAVSVALERPDVRVVATDCSAAALAVAAENARRHGAQVHLAAADLATAIRRADVVVANLPYIPSAEVLALEPEIRDWEPLVALDGGEDGLSLIRRLVVDCAMRLRPACLALEVAYGQATEAAAFVEDQGASAEVMKDLAGIDRVVVARWA
jgi:release factor glutamine methyltransferase